MSYLYLIIFFSLHFLCFRAQSSDAESDRRALLSFKGTITEDPLQVLSSWNDSSSFCNWTGVTCSLTRPRVVTLSLPSRKLRGSLSPAILDMSFLRVIDLSDNFFQGLIPGDIGRLFRLRQIFLMQNGFDGEIPGNLSRCTELRVINFNYNNLTGNIPADISMLPNLVALHVSANQLTGGIPPVIGNISSLRNLSIAQNYLGGVIPHDLGRLENLEFLQVSNNNLSGTIPGSIFNLSTITRFAVALNQLTGSLPSSIGSYFPNLKELHFGVNGFSGGIPFSLSNISGLQIIDIPDNKFTGKVPVDFGRLPNLQRLNVGRNLLGNEDVEGLKFIDSLVNCSKLETLSISRNRFSGPLPGSIGNLSITMKRLLLDGNNLSGGIPSGITNLVNLNTLNVSWNQFDGPIFPDIDKLFNLRQLFMNVNRFSGRIPPAIGNLTVLFELRLDGNELEGDIPANLGDCKQLKLLNLSDNNLSGIVPSHIFGLSSLTITFNLARNLLSGSLPIEVGNFINLIAFDLSGNKFSGSIPVSLGLCVSLENIFLEGNMLQGSIPKSLSALKNLQDLDLSRNNMAGIIPEFLQDFVFLRYLNLSFNNFSGEVPKRGVFANTSGVSLYGNSRLCGGVLQLELPSCPPGGDSPRRVRSITLKEAIVISFGVLGLFLLLYFAVSMILKRSRRKGLITSPSEEWSSNFSYNELAKATNGFSTENLLGVGGFASVYKGTRSENGNLIAVKVLNSQHIGTSKTYMAECEALRSIKHRNLVKILGSCSTLDSNGRDFKAIVLEFMPNGCLEKWLHPNQKNQHENLDIRQRLNIAIDVASALEYLHHYSHIPVAHCDLKPGNVLLDTDLCAHLSDFGLARFIRERVDAGTQINSTGIKGSFGYVAPEYGKGGPVSVSGDIYSFGILLLEMFLGIKPTDEVFTDGLTLHSLAKNSLRDNVMDIIDPRLALSTRAASEATDHITIEVKHDEQVEKLLVLIIRIGVSCSQEMPKERMSIKEANVKLQLIRDNFLKNDLDD